MAIEFNQVQEVVPSIRSLFGQVFLVHGGCTNKQIKAQKKRRLEHSVGTLRSSARPESSSWLADGYKHIISIYRIRGKRKRLRQLLDHCLLHLCLPEHLPTLGKNVVHVIMIASLLVRARHRYKKNPLSEQSLEKTFFQKTYLIPVDPRIS